MRRVAVVAVVVGAAAVAVAVTAVARRGDGGSATVATVANHKITRNELDLAVDHFHEEADREGRPFPAENTNRYAAVQRQARRYLVELAELEVAAARLGVHVSDEEVEARVASSASGEEEEGASIRVKAEAVFLRQAARQQLLQERVYRKLAAGVRVSEAEVRAYYGSHRRLFGSQPLAAVIPLIRVQLITAKRNAKVERWLARARRALAPEVHYEKLD